MNIQEVLEAELTEQQRRAARDPAREILCLACAGSGKSRTLAYRIARLLAEDQAPQGIVAFTFTDKAADSIKRRVAEALSKVGMSTDVMGAMYIGTIHSYCQHVLGEMDAVYRQFDVLDENRLKLYLISRFYELGMDALRPRARNRSYFDTIKQVSNAWKVLNDEMLSVETVSHHDAELGDVLQRLSASLRANQFIDFSLMIRNVAGALSRQEPVSLSVTAHVKHLLVDEYQDVSPSQEVLINQLHETADTVFVVGDDDQSIYAWRGADVSNILNFRQRFSAASEHTLSENFRSTDAIVAASDSFIAAELGPSRIAKQPRSVSNKSPRDFRSLWFTARDDESAWIAGRIQALLGTDYSESDGSHRGLTPADFAVLMRSTRSPEGDDRSPRHAPYTQALARLGIPFSLESGGGPFDRPQVSVIRETFELLRDGSPSRAQVQTHFDTLICPAFPAASFDALVRVITDWGRLIHTPPGGARRRVYPQKLVYDLLEAFGISRAPLSDEVMRDIGLFSKMIQDVEAVYMSVDSPGRFREILNFLNNAAETGYDVSTDDVLQRPDAVVVTTVHKAKGLEYPVVFVVDVEDQRFPGTRRSYDGWLPDPVIQPALARGAYQSRRDEEARLFYTSVTRAERFLYVTGSERLPGGRKRWRPSPFANRLTHAELSTSAVGLPADLTQAPQKRRIDERILPTSFTEIRYYLRCPMDYRFRQGFGFSPPIPDMFGFGKTVHTAIEKLHETFPDAAPDANQAANVARGTFHLKHVPRSGDPENNPGPYERAEAKAVEIAQNYSRDFHQDFQRSRQVEARFEIGATDCVISGSIDLLLRENDKGEIVDAEVVDFKAIEGGADPAENLRLDWTELSLQVQLYAKAAKDVLGEAARTGSVHLLKDGQRVQVPITDEAIQNAVQNVEWAVQGILAGDYPMRPHPDKCGGCDFKNLCPKAPQQFQSPAVPPAILLPTGGEAARAFSQFAQG